MKIKIQKNKLLEILKAPYNVLTQNIINPVLTGILLEVVNNKLIVISSNENLSIFCETDKLKVEKEGKILVKGKIFYSIINKIDNQEITLENIDSSVLRVSSSNFSSDINLLEGFSYPSINFSTTDLNSISINPIFFKTIIKKITITTNTDPNRSTILSGVLFDTTRSVGVIECVGTDGHHLTYMKEKYQGEKFKIVVSVENLKIINELIQEKEDVLFFIKKNHLLLKIKNIILNCRLLEGEYPSAFNTLEAKQKHNFVVKKQELLNAIERGVVIASAEKKPSVLFNISQNIIRISCRSIEYGNSYEEVKINNYSGDDISVSFNAKYLQDILNNIDDVLVSIEFNDVNKPFFFLNPNNPDYISLILPIRMI